MFFWKHFFLILVPFIVPILKIFAQFFQPNHFESVPLLSLYISWLWSYVKIQKEKNFNVEVCIPSLILVGKRLDGTGGHFPNCRDRDETTYAWYCCSGKFGKNSGKIMDGAGLLSTTWEKSRMFLKWTKIQNFS